MTETLPTLPAELAGLDLPALLAEIGLPEERLVAAFTAGSLVQGWGNADSDVDIYLICDREVHTPFFADAHMTRLTQAEVPVGGTVAVGRKCDIELWTEAQVRELFDRLSFARHAVTTSLLESFSYFEVDFLEKLGHGLALRGVHIVTSLQADLAASAWRNVLVSEALILVDTYITDALGQLDAGDVVSAVLSSKIAFGYAVDTVTNGAGVHGRNAKWRARRVRLADSPILPFSRYWSVETMATYDDDKPAEWILDVVSLCRDVAARVPVRAV